VKAASHTEKQTSVTTADDHQTTPTVEKRSIETQTENEQAVQTEATSVPTSPYTGEEMEKLLQTTAAALIWIIKEMKPTKQQSQVLTQLHAMTKMFGLAKHRRNSEPSLAKVNSAGNRQLIRLAHPGLLGLYIACLFLPIVRHCYITNC